MESQRLEPLEYYKWFWKRWRLNRKVQRLNYIAKGFYRELLDEQFAEGFIPDDVGELAHICACPVGVMEEHWPSLRVFFEELEPGQLVNSLQEELRTELDRSRAAQSRAGKRSAEVRSNTRSTTVEQPLNTCSTPVQPEEKRREEKRNTPAVTSDDVPADRGKLLGTLPLNVGEFSIYEKDAEEAQALYPAIDVKQEYRNMKGWLLASPKRRKTQHGIRKFINSWLSRAQDSARGIAAAPTPPRRVYVND